MSTKKSNGELSWDTTYNTAEGVMIHTFAAGVKMWTKIETGKSTILKDDKVIAEGETIQIGTYERRLIQIAKEAEKLKAFES